MSYRDKPRSATLNINVQGPGDGYTELDETRMPPMTKPGKFCDNAPARQPQVENATIRLASLAQSIQAALSTLEGKLSPVLRPEPCSDSKGEGREHVCPLAEDLLDTAAVLEGALLRIHDIERRIEV